MTGRDRTSRVIHRSLPTPQAAVDPMQLLHHVLAAGVHWLTSPARQVGDHWTGIYVRPNPRCYGNCARSGCEAADAYMNELTRFVLARVNVDEDDPVAGFRSRLASDVPGAPWPGEPPPCYRQWCRGWLPDVVLFDQHLVLRAPARALIASLPARHAPQDVYHA